MRFLLVLTLVLALPACSLLRTHPKPEPPFTRLPGGSFVMGSPDEEDSYALPAHPVTVEPFALMTREVTFAEFDLFAAADDDVARPDSGDFGRGARAVVQVTWDEAAAFCDWIGARLPTEPEWEWAARGGEAAQRYAGTNDPDSLARFARFQEDASLLSTSEVRRRPNPFGLYDLSGNAYEWIGAFYQSYPEPGETPVWFDLNGPPDDLRMVRGGSYSSTARLTKTFTRASTLRDIRSETIGFRCARDL